MSNIKTTSDGYSFHTLELKAHPDGEIFNRALKLLYKAAKKSKDPRQTTYPLTKYNSKNIKSHCSTMLSSCGILLYLTEKISKKGWHSYTIKAVVNPRKVLDPECSYLGIAPTDEESLSQFQDKFTTLMRRYHLPEFLDEWTLTRLDLCVNLQLNKKSRLESFAGCCKRTCFHQNWSGSFSLNLMLTKNFRKSKRMRIGTACAWRIAPIVLSFMTSSIKPR